MKAKAAAIEILKVQPRTYALILVLVLVNTGFFMYEALYQVPRYEKLQNQWFEKRKTLTGGAGQDPGLMYQQGIKDLAAWQERIVPKKRFTRFIGTLFETASNNSLALNGVSYKIVPVSDKKLVAYSLDIKVNGKYGAVKSFLSDLERMPEIVTIDNISLNNKSMLEDMVDLKVLLTVYLKLEEQ